MCEIVKSVNDLMIPRQLTERSLTVVVDAFIALIHTCKCVSVLMVAATCKNHKLGLMIDELVDTKSSCVSY